GFPRQITLTDAFALASIQDSLAAESLALGLGTGNASLAAGLNQAALELRYPGHDGQHELADVRCGVTPGLSQGGESATALAQGSDDVMQVTSRAGYTVELGHDHGVARQQCFHELGKLRPAIHGLARSFLRIDAFAAVSLQGFDLRRIILGVGRYPCITV